MTSSQPTQPLTDAELAQIRGYLDNTDAYGPRSVGNHNMLCRLLTEVDRLRAESVRHVDCNAEAWAAAAARVTRDLRAELDSMTQFAESLRAERDRSVRSCGELGVELDRLRADNEQMRLEVVQMESGAQIAMNAGVTALQEVKRLEAMIAAVVAIHKPTGINSWGHRTCNECDTPGYYQEWPCPTLVALGFEER